MVWSTATAGYHQQFTEIITRLPQKLPIELRLESRDGLLDRKSRGLPLVDKKKGALTVGRTFDQDFAVFAVTAPEQVSAIDSVFVLTGSSDDVSCASAFCHSMFITHKICYVNIFSDYKWK